MTRHGGDLAGVLPHIRRLAASTEATNWLTAAHGYVWLKLMRANRAIAALGNGTPFLLVYYGSDGSGGWQPLTRPLRTVTTVDRFALVEPGDYGPEMRMLQVPELRRAMGFSERFALPYGTRRERIRLLISDIYGDAASSIGLSAQRDLLQITTYDPRPVWTARD